MTVGSKAFMMKEQAFRKALAVVKQATLKKQALMENGKLGKPFVQVNKKSLLYKRALFQEQFDKTLREE